MQIKLVKFQSSLETAVSSLNHMMRDLIFCYSLTFIQN